MSNEFEIIDAVPTLTLEPDLEEVPAVVEQPQIQKANEPVLTPQEQQMVNDFAAKIDVENTAQIMQFGAGTQKKMAEFSDAALANVRTQDLGEVGDLIVNVVGELKGFDMPEAKGLLGFFKKKAGELENMKNRFAKAEANVATISDALQAHQVRLLKDSAVLDKMYDQNLAYFKELSMYILAGKQKLEEVRTGKLAQLQQIAQQTGLAEDAQAARDLADKCDRFEKKIHDLMLTREISIQTAPQIRMIQNNDLLMTEKIQTAIVNTIPLWKSQMVLSLSMYHSKQAMQASSSVSSVTNELLMKNAEDLHMGSVEVARESERGIVELETLKKTNEHLIATLEEVRQIQDDGRARRAAAENELGVIEAELKQKLLEIKG